MLFANYMIKEILAKIKIQIKNIKVTAEEIRGEKAKAYGFIYDMKLALEELSIATSSDDYKTTYIAFLNNRLEDIKNAENAIELTNILQSIQSRFENLDLNSDPYLDYNYRQYNHYKDINKDLIRTIATNVVATRNINIFDTSCGSGELINIFKEIKPNSMCYGLEKDNSRAELAKKNATKIIKGQLKGSRIKNEAFDILIANCDIAYTLKDNMAFGAVAKQEKVMLQNIYKYLATDGLVIIGLPFYRLYKDVCSIIAKQYKNVTIIRGFGDNHNDSNLNMVYIIGQKDNKKSIDENIYNQLRRCCDYSKTPSMFSITLPTYKLGYNYIEIDLFKGSVLDMDELYNIVNTSGCLDAMLNKQKVDKINENTKKPLLPFNVGQIGLVLTSGCLDGVIDEGDGHYHLVKGRVSKKSDTTREMSDGILEEKEIISNRVEINVILPNGDFKTLA